MIMRMKSGSFILLFPVPGPESLLNDEQNELGHWAGTEEAAGSRNAKQIDFLR